MVEGFIDSRSIHCVMLFCFPFAASDEWHQSFVPDRFGTIQVVLIDGLGVCEAGGRMLFKLGTGLKAPNTDRKF